MTGPSFIRTSPCIVQAPGSLVTARTRRSIASAGSSQRTRASDTVSFGACEMPSIGWCNGRIEPFSIPVKVARASWAPSMESRSSSAVAVSAGSIWVVK